MLVRERYLNAAKPAQARGIEGSAFMGSDPIGNGPSPFLWPALPARTGHNANRTDRERSL